MIAGRFQAPRPVQATDALGTSAVDSVVARRRAELARLSLTARTASQRLEVALASLDAAPPSEAHRAPEDLLAVVDAMLEKAVRASEVAIEAAHGEAEFIVAAAVAERADLLRRSGVESGDHAAVDPDRSAPKGPSRRVTPPPTARDLWLALGCAARPSAVTLVPPSPPEPSTEPASGAPSMATVPMVAGGEVRPMADAEPSATHAPVATLLLDEPHLDGEAGSPDAFDAFWQEATYERRVRDRLRRRNPKEGA